MKCACPHCGKAFELDESLVGQKGRCDKCQTKFIIKPVKPISAVAPTVPERKGRGRLWVTLLLLSGIGGYLVYDKSDNDNVVDSIDLEKVTETDADDGALELFLKDKKVIWSGIAGDVSVGLQNFNVAVSDTGYISLESDTYDGSIDGDETVWLDVTLEGDYGVMKLFSMPYDLLIAGYGKPEISIEEPFILNNKRYSESLSIHAKSYVTWQLPKGTRKVKGIFSALSYGKVQPKIFYINSD